MDSLPETDVERHSPVESLAAIETFAMFLVNVKRLAAGQQPIFGFDQLSAHSQSEAFFAAKERIACWRMAEQMWIAYLRGDEHTLMTTRFDAIPAIQQWGWFRAAQVAEAVHHATMTGENPVRTAEIVVMQGRETRTQGVR